jgi:hypothetical protein
MERTPWKLATIGAALVTTTALGTGLTTAYALRAPEPVSAPAASVAVRPAVATVAPRPPRPAAAPVTPRMVAVATVAVPADCDTGSERALRIAKPGLLGALLGAGLGAAGGGIADGGRAAGKGALIGGLAGAAIGTGFGAYKTQNECGTILGNGVSLPR